MNRVEAPWNDDQVASLTGYQDAGYVHPFTHGDGDEKVDLIATRDGWIAKEGGPVVQTWAHEFMTNWSWRNTDLEAWATRVTNIVLSVTDLNAQDLLWTYAQRLRPTNAKLADELEAALIAVEFRPAMCRVRLPHPHDSMSVCILRPGHTDGHWIRSGCNGSGKYVADTHGGIVVHGRCPGCKACMTEEAWAALAPEGGLR